MIVALVLKSKFTKNRALRKIQNGKVPYQMGKKTKAQTHQTNRLHSVLLRHISFCQFTNFYFILICIFLKIFRFEIRIYNMDHDKPADSK